MPDLELHKEPLLSTVHSQGHCLENMEIVSNTLTGTPSGKKQIVSNTLTGTPSGNTEIVSNTLTGTLSRQYRLSTRHSQGHSQENTETVSNTLTGTLSGKYRDSLQYTHRDTLRKIQRFVYNTLTGTLCNAWREVCFHLGVHHIIIHNKWTRSKHLLIQTLTLSIHLLLSYMLI